MDAKKYIVNLSDEDCKTLNSFISTGERISRSNTRVHILLKANDGWIAVEMTEKIRTRGVD